MSFDTTTECPICMEEFQGATNKVITECGHTFHTNCLMKAVAYNGFGCPYCRTEMAEEIYNSEHEEEEDEDEDDSYEDEEDARTIDSDDAHEATTNMNRVYVPTYLTLFEMDRKKNNETRILGGFRWLFNRANNEETVVYQQEDDEIEHEVIRAPSRVNMRPIEPPSPKPSVEYLSKKLVEQGVTMEDLLKSVLYQHSAYESMEYELSVADDELYRKLNVLISEGEGTY